jgi:hypothetical protein
LASSSACCCSSEAAAELRQLEGARLDTLQAQWWPHAIRGDYPAAKFVLRIMERRAKLFGLDAPQQVRVSTPDLDRRIEEMLTELATMPGELLQLDASDADTDSE